MTGVRCVLGGDFVRSENSRVVFSQQEESPSKDGAPLLQLIACNSCQCVVAWDFFLSHAPVKFLRGRFRKSLSRCAKKHKFFEASSELFSIARCSKAFKLLKLTIFLSPKIVVGSEASFLPLCPKLQTKRVGALFVCDLLPPLSAVDSLL